MAGSLDRFAVAPQLLVPPGANMPDSFDQLFDALAAEGLGVPLGFDLQGNALWAKNNEPVNVLGATGFGKTRSYLVSAVAVYPGLVLAVTTKDDLLKGSLAGRERIAARKGGHVVQFDPYGTQDSTLTQYRWDYTHNADAPGHAVARGAGLAKLVELSATEKGWGQSGGQLLGSYFYASSLLGRNLGRLKADLLRNNLVEYEHALELAKLGVRPFDDAEAKQWMRDNHLTMVQQRDAQIARNKRRVAKGKEPKPIVEINLENYHEHALEWQVDQARNAREQLAREAETHGVDWYLDRVQQGRQRSRNGHELLSAPHDVFVNVHGDALPEGMSGSIIGTAKQLIESYNGPEDLADFDVADGSEREVKRPSMLELVRGHSTIYIVVDGDAEAARPLVATWIRELVNTWKRDLPWRLAHPDIAPKSFLLGLDEAAHISNLPELADYINEGRGHNIQVVTMFQGPKQARDGWGPNKGDIIVESNVHQLIFKGLGDNAYMQALLAPQRPTFQGEDVVVVRPEADNRAGYADRAQLRTERKNYETLMQYARDHRLPAVKAETDVLKAIMQRRIQLGQRVVRPEFKTGRALHDVRRELMTLTGIDEKFQQLTPVTLSDLENGPKHLVMLHTKSQPLQQVQMLDYCAHPYFTPILQGIQRAPLVPATAAIGNESARGFTAGNAGFGFGAA